MPLRQTVHEPLVFYTNTLATMLLKSALAICRTSQCYRYVVTYLYNYLTGFYWRLVQGKTQGRDGVCPCGTFIVCQLANEQIYP
jgi:hypothetical protein